MAVLDIFCERCPTCGSEQMTPPFVRDGEAWQACFACGQPVVLRIGRADSDEAALSQRSDAEEAKLRRRYKVLLDALEGMLLNEAEWSKKHGLKRAEPEIVSVARDDLREAVKKMEARERGENLAPPATKPTRAPEPGGSVSGATQ